MVFIHCRSLRSVKFSIFIILMKVAGLLLLPFRAIYTLWGYLIFFLLCLIGYFIIVFEHFRKPEGLFRRLFPLYQLLCRVWLRLMGIRLVVEGAENIDKHRSYVIVGNHSSTLDMFVCTKGIPIYFKGLGKLELDSYPVIGLLFKVGVILIDRSNPESRTRGVELCKKELAAGNSIFIMPEGTRNRTREPLLPFKSGAFRMAIDTLTPILPFVVLHARSIYPMWEPFLLRPGRIVMRFLPPVPVEGLTEDDVPQLLEQVRTQMETIILAEDEYFTGKLAKSAPGA